MSRCTTDTPATANRSGGFTLIELLLVVALIGIITALAVPMVLRARMAGNESAAIGSLRAVNTAQAGYAVSAASGGYAPLLAVLTHGSKREGKADSISSPSHKDSRTP